MIEKLADYHIHTSLCNHASGTMRQYVEAAIQAGLKEMGFSDHNPFVDNYVSDYRMRPRDFEIYMDTIDDLKTSYPEIVIKKGIELDFIPGAVNYISNFAEKYQFDYIIGSVHYLEMNGTRNVTYLNDIEDKDKARMFKIYFETVSKAANTGIFDIIAHFDLPRRFWGDLPEESYQHAEKALETIKANDVCIEINTSGFRTKSVEEPFPGNHILEMVKALDIPVTLGSDSHTPDDVASYFYEAVDLLQSMGYKSVNKFSNHIRNAISLNGT